MKWYLVKQTSKATDNNPNGRGEVIIYYGKRGKRLGFDVDNEYLVTKYGYKTEHGAKRNYIYNLIKSSWGWQRTVDIVAVETEVCGMVVEVKS